MAGGGHGLLKISLGPNMPNPSTAVSGVARPQGRQSAAVFYHFGHPTPYTYGEERDFEITFCLENNECQPRVQRCERKLGGSGNRFGGELGENKIL
jgi:hypothetical protein